MFYLIVLLGGFVLGLSVVASNPSPYFAALGLALVSGFGCGALAWYGGSLLSLILFLIYLGGMLVVFAYSAALAAEPHPGGWGGASAVVLLVCYMLIFTGASVFFGGNWYKGSWVLLGEGDTLIFQGVSSGVATLYACGGEVLVLTAGVLLLTLFVVLELTRGLSRGGLRAV